MPELPSDERLAVVRDPEREPGLTARLRTRMLANTGRSEIRHGGTAIPVPDDSFFLIHWNSAEAEEFATPIRSHGCGVEIETDDDTAVVDRVKALQPMAVLIFLSRLPSHGRLAALALAGDAKTRDIPIIFVGGKEWTVEQTHKEFPRATLVSAEDICSALKPFLPEDET